MNYKAAPCQALNLPATATDEDIAARCVALLGAILTATSAGAKAFSAPLMDVETEVAKALLEVTTFSAVRRQSGESVELQIARQMGNRPEALAKYGSSTRA